MLPVKYSCVPSLKLIVRAHVRSYYHYKSTNSTTPVLLQLSLHKLEAITCVWAIEFYYGLESSRSKITMYSEQLFKAVCDFKLVGDHFGPHVNMLLKFMKIKPKNSEILPNMLLSWICSHRLWPWHFVPILPLVQVHNTSKMISPVI